MRRLACAALWLAAACSAAAADAGAAAQQVLVLLHLPTAHFRPDTAYSGNYGDGVASAARRRVAAELARAHGLTLVADWPLPVLGVDCYVMALPADRAPQRVIEALARDARVEWAQPMNVYRARADALSHDDPLYRFQPAAEAWHLRALHALATGRGVRVAVIDSGVEIAHPDLAGQVAEAENFADARPYVAERHGTAVAAIIGARADDHLGIAGVAPRARLLALRACWEEAPDATLCTSLGLAKALQHAITRDAAVINLSLGGPPDRLLGRLLDIALAQGIVVVAAVDRALPDGGFPAAHPGVVAVADEPTALHGALAAPGRDVPTAAPGGRWAWVSGSSYAAAHMSGLFALLRELGAPAAASPAAAALVTLAAGGIDTCATLGRLVGPRACSPAVASASPTATQP